MIHGEPAYIPTEVVTMSPALFYSLLAQAWDEGAKAGELYQFKVSRFLRGVPDPYPDDLANPYRAKQIEGDLSGPLGSGIFDKTNYRKKERHEGQP